MLTSVSSEGMEVAAGRRVSLALVYARLSFSFRTRSSSGMERS